MSVLLVILPSGFLVVNNREEREDYWKKKKEEKTLKKKFRVFAEDGASSGSGSECERGGGSGGRERWGQPVRDDVALCGRS